ncbi:M48 family metalloprotease [Actibacterium sp.]|uniref:M48 family metalloprotease n=1 Tax=Actibacterium sp. TaxID=1872125 RepID=UPI003561AE39
MKAFSLLVLALGLAGCVQTTDPAVEPRVSMATALNNFEAVRRKVEPVAEAECRARTRGMNCNFLIGVDATMFAEANAFQGLDDNNRPVIAFTVALIADARNVDELAFVLGHEAAHHILAHLAEQERNAAIGADLMAEEAARRGASEREREKAREVGAYLGALAFSQEMELEADALGTVIAAQAGYDPLHGAQYFNRMDDPGNKMLGTHPPNSKRLKVVQDVVDSL